MTDTKKITFQTLTAFPLNTEFSGIELQQTVCQKAGQVHYPDTILRYMREWREQNPKHTIILVSKRKSIYRKVKK